MTATTIREGLIGRWHCVDDSFVSLTCGKSRQKKSCSFSADRRHGNLTGLSEIYNVIQLRKLVTILDKPLLERFIDIYQFRILGIADSVPGSGELLKDHYATLEKELLQKSPIFSMGKYSIDFAWFEYRDPNELRIEAVLDQKGKQMLKFVKSLVSELTKDSESVKLTVGPRKTRKSIQRRVAIDRDPQLLRFVHDILRCRLICRDLRVLERICAQILTELVNGNCYQRILETEVISGHFKFPRIVRYRNHFAYSRQKYYAISPNPFRGINLTIALDENHGFELQLLTEHTHIATRLGHPFFVSRIHTFPDVQLQEWLVDFLWKVNIVDAEAYLRDYNGISKMAIPEHILHKTDSLSKGEYEQMKQHTIGETTPSIPCVKTKTGPHSWNSLPVQTIT